ncbi:tetratricopeptide repeat protein [Maricaulis sp.]|uniref:tetratricopeptide repeat protein n=1 Tax=Maricaulis sp. TaxID=1486257 RepID=UPI0032977886
MHRALLISTLCTGLVAGPASAELRDVLTRADGLNGQVWLAFDEQPRSAELSQTAGRVSLMIGGVAVRTREVSPYRADLVSRVSITPVADGALVELGQAAAWQNVRAELRQGGVLVSFSLDAPVAAASRPSAPSHAPATDPATASPAPGDHGTGTAASHGQPAADAVSHAASGAGAATGHAPADPAPADEAGHEPAAEQTPAPESHAPASSGAAVPANPVAAAASSATGECAETGAAVAENPWDDESLHRHAACLTRTGELQPAAIIYEQMLAFAPDDFRALIALAEVRAEQGDTAEARELYSQAASYAISDAEAARARARLRELQQR